MNAAGFEPTKYKTTVLKTVPFDRSGMRPHSLAVLILKNQFHFLKLKLKITIIKVNIVTYIRIKC
jgi:hypothetical protein